LRQGRIWSAEGQTVMATDDRRALVGGICILATGWDTAAERDGCDDRHGWEVWQNKVVCDVVCVLASSFSSLLLSPLSGDFKKMAKTFYFLMYWSL
jgi:hypothetical protein